jgi:hypothetical protein
LNCNYIGLKQFYIFEDDKVLQGKIYNPYPEVIEVAVIINAGQQNETMFVNVEKFEYYFNNGDSIIVEYIVNDNITTLEDVKVCLKIKSKYSCH